jgi:acyl carrier protein
MTTVALVTDGRGEDNMDDQALKKKLIEQACKVFQQPDLLYADDQLFRDILGFDSIRAVQFILAMEAAVGVTLHEDEVDGMHTMGDMLSILRSKTVSSPAT